MTPCRPRTPDLPALWTFLFVPDGSPLSHLVQSRAPTSTKYPGVPFRLRGGMQFGGSCLESTPGLPGIHKTLFPVNAGELRSGDVQA